MTSPDLPAALLELCPAYRPTPLRQTPRLAKALGLASVAIKDEGARPLGSFKSLGGVYAGLRALSRVTGRAIADVLAGEQKPGHGFMLVAASDGNHGLAVAAAAKLGGATARIFLPAAASTARIARIERKGAQVVQISGTYDDAVDAARRAALDERGLLIPDTSDDPDDRVVADVMAGYGVLVTEIGAQLAETGAGAPSHIFVQAGVGGLAAAIAKGLREQNALVVVVEPQEAACVAAGLAAGRPVRVAGALETAAEMLSCGEASAAALRVLRDHGARALSVSEASLLGAPGFLRAHGGPLTTPTGAAGLAGLRAALADKGVASKLGLNEESRVLLIATEAALP
jgi:diaminopropionate ammonia-lyase